MKKILFFPCLFLCIGIFTSSWVRAEQATDRLEAFNEAVSQGDITYIESFLQGIRQATPEIASTLLKALPVAYLHKNWEAYTLIDAKIRELGLFAV